MWTTGFTNWDALHKSSGNGAYFAILPWEECNWISTTTLVDGLVFCGVESFGSRGLERSGTLIPWRIKKTAATMTSGNKNLLWLK